jgi:hypothetical protein
MAAFFAAFVRRGRVFEEEGPVTEREQICIETAQQGHGLATQLALAVARVLALLQRLCPHLPSDIMSEIALAAIELPEASNREVCRCHGGAPPSISLKAPQNGVSQQRHVRCTLCGKVSLATIAVRVPTSEGLVVMMATIAGGDAVWKPCRHFHREIANSRAVRHRMSGLHSFRTIVCSEWVMSGTAEYVLDLEHLQQPGSFGVGVVTPDAAVNCDTAWVAGSRWENSGGLIIEGLVGDVNMQERSEYDEIRAIDTRTKLRNFVAIDDTSTSSSSSPSLPSLSQLEVGGLRQGQQLWVRIDASRGTMDIAFCSGESMGTGRGPILRLQMPEQPSHSRVRHRSHSRSEEEEEGDEEMSEDSSISSANGWRSHGRTPFTLAIGLKFAGDTARLRRLV